MRKRRRQPKELTRRFPGYPDIIAIHLYGGLRYKVVVTVDKNAADITVRYPDKDVRFEQMRASLAIRGAKGSRGDLAVTLENKDGTSFEISPVGDEHEGTIIQITIPAVPGLARSSADYLSRKIAVALHNDSNTGRGSSGNQGLYLSDPEAYEKLRKPTFEN